MPRRKKKQRKNQVGRDSNVRFDIENELRQQRLRHQHRTENENKQQAKSEANNEIEFVPFEIPKSQNVIVLRNFKYRPMPFSNQDASSLLPLWLMGASQSAIANPMQRTKLRQLWYGRYLFESMHVFPKASSFYSSTRWRDYQVPDGLHCSWDLTCKFHLHPSARTFDVVNADSASELPCIATVVQGGVLLMQPGFQQSTENRVNFLRR